MMYRLESGRSLASQLNRAQPMDFLGTEASPKAAKLASTDRRSSNDHKASALQYTLFQLESAGSTEVRPWLNRPKQKPDSFLFWRLGSFPEGILFEGGNAAFRRIFEPSLVNKNHRVRSGSSLMHTHQTQPNRAEPRKRNIPKVSIRLGDAGINALSHKEK